MKSCSWEKPCVPCAGEVRRHIEANFMVYTTEKAARSCCNLLATLLAGIIDACYFDTLWYIWFLIERF